MNKDNLVGFFTRIPKFFGRGVNIGRVITLSALSLIFLVCLYYLLGMAVIHKIDDDVDFQPNQSNPGESRTIAMAISLIDREVSKNGWVANDPFFMPGYLLDNMPNYQQGIIYALVSLPGDRKSDGTSVISFFCDHHHLLLPQSRHIREGAFHVLRKLRITEQHLPAIEQ